MSVEIGMMGNVSKSQLEEGNATECRYDYMLGVLKIDTHQHVALLTIW